MIAATESGRILAGGSPSPLQDRLAAALDKLPEAERAAITLSLERVVDLMRIGEVSAARIDTGVSLHIEQLATDGVADTAGGGEDAGERERSAAVSVPAHE